MKKLLSLTFFALVGALLIFSSCSDDDGDSPGKPTMSTSETTISGNEGESVDVEISWTAGSGVKLISSNNAIATVPSSLSGTSGTFTSTISVGNDDEEITYTLIDNDDRIVTLTVNVVVGLIVIQDQDLEPGQTYNWTKDKSYLLDGLVYLESDATLNIEAGTIVKFKSSPTTGDGASSLIITRGAQIFAEGTAEEPIIFTSEEDDLEGNLGPDQNQKWAGIIILGYAPVEKDGANQVQIEGISTGEPRGLYGGQIPDDNSGVLKYVSIRYTGFALNGQSGDEIQGLTLGGVGSGTTVEYIDIFSSADDGIEIFGGTVNLKYISVAFATDDSFDFDQGWTGNGQFVFALHGDFEEALGDYLGEWDGYANVTDIFTAPNLVNGTFIGGGKDLASPKRNVGFLMREGFAGKLVNSVIADVPGNALQITNAEGENSSCYRINNSKTDDRGTFQLELLNNTWTAIKNYDGADFASFIVGDCVDDVKTALIDNANVAFTDNILGNTESRSSGIDPRPADAANVEDTYDVSGWGLENVNYRGAFEPGVDTWLKGWSTLSKYGYLAE